MQIGKIPTNILKRSVTNLIGKGPDAGMDCATIEVAPGSILTSTEVGPYAVCKAANNIWAAGGELIGVNVAFLMKSNAREIAIKRLTRQTLDECKLCGTVILGGHTEVTDKVVDNYVTVTALGRGSRDYAAKNIRGGEDIVVTKWLGIENAALLLGAAESREKIDNRFCNEYIEPLAEVTQWIPVREEAETAMKAGADVVAMHDMSDGGVFGALWEMCVAADCGLEIELSKIPIRQEISEIHTFFGIDIYRARSAGSLIIACRDGEALCARLEAVGIPAVMIGQFTENHDKIIHSHDEIRYLNEK